jgi:5-methylcytosine-specific restriction protein A
MMTRTSRDIEALIRNSVGIATSVDFAPESQGQRVNVHSRDNGMEHPHGWEVSAERFDLHARFSFKFDDYAANLKSLYVSRLMEVSNSVKQQEISLTEFGFDLKFHSTDGILSLSDLLSSSPSSLQELQAKFRVSLDRFDSLNDDLYFKLICMFVALCISPLLPDDIDEEFVGEPGLPEGAVKQVLVNKYERSPRNRSACISYYGTKCNVCDFDFGLTYGEFANDYIHVHHVIPVSELGPSYMVDPINDLVPLCPNCHSAIHIKNPPLLPEELRSILYQRKQK